ncbi:MAG: hypothetical protein H8D33_03015 [Cryomorphaceae bacterium]|nr:hypothetical protein [Cryomorphaceae bacterium]
MKTKMKTKTILSVCMLTVLLYACTKNSVRPEVLTDCMGVENGVATYDDCRDCHQSYIYNFVTHVPTYIDDTTGLVLDTSSEMLILAGSAQDIASNPNWNACIDCMGTANGLAAMDDSSCCHQSYIYNDSTHVQMDIDDTTGLVLGTNEMVILAGSALDIMFNPNWNTGCK